jgi:hypothetical protein
MFTTFVTMNTIVRHIQYLITRNDCVIIPGLGALLAHYDAARIDSASHTIIPPSRTIIFNNSLNHNDGVLASSIARRNRISYDSAMALINEETNAMRHQLISDGEISLGRLGVLKSNNDSQSSMIFEPFDNYSSRYNSLKALNITPLKQLTREQASPEELEEFDARNRNRFKTSFIRIAASIALLIGLSITLSTPISFKDSQLANLGATVKMATPEIVDTVAQPTTPLNEQLIIYRVSDDIASEVVDIQARKQYQEAIKNHQNPKTIQPTVIAEPTNADSESGIRLNGDDSYFLIVASFPSQQQANKFIAEHSNTNLAILDKDGRYRVYAATGNSMKQAMAPTRSASFASSYPDAWVCKR